MTHEQIQSIQLTKDCIAMMHLENKHASEDVNPAFNAPPFSQACIENAYDRLDSKLCEITFTAH